MNECPNLFSSPWVELCLNPVKQSGVVEGNRGHNSWAFPKIFIQQPVWGGEECGPWKQLFLLSLSKLGTGLSGHNFSLWEVSVPLR